MGDPEATVQIIEFTDYQCPFCKHRAEATFPAILEKLSEYGQAFYGIKDPP